MSALMAIGIWVACAGLTTIPASRNSSTASLVDRYALRHIAAGLLVAWPAILTFIAVERVRRAVGL